jgi:hypothetical protein
MQPKDLMKWVLGGLAALGLTIGGMMFSAQQAQSTTVLYVSVSGGGDGSDASHPMTLAQANAAAAPDTRIIVAAGTYAVFPWPATSGTASNRIIYIGADSSATGTMFADPSFQSSPAFNYTTVRNFRRNGSLTFYHSGSSISIGDTLDTFRVTGALHLFDWGSITVPSAATHGLIGYNTGGRCVTTGNYASASTRLATNLADLTFRGESRDDAYSAWIYLNTDSNLYPNIVNMERVRFFFYHKATTIENYIQSAYSIQNSTRTDVGIFVTYEGSARCMYQFRSYSGHNTFIRDTLQVTGGGPGTQLQLWLQVTGTGGELGYDTYRDCVFQNLTTGGEFSVEKPVPGYMRFYGCTFETTNTNRPAFYFDPTAGGPGNDWLFDHCTFFSKYSGGAFVIPSGVGNLFTLTSNMYYVGSASVPALNAAALTAADKARLYTDFNLYGSWWSSLPSSDPNWIPGNRSIYLGGTTYARPGPGDASGWTSATRDLHSGVVGPGDYDPPGVALVPSTQWGAPSFTDSTYTATFDARPTQPTALDVRNFNGFQTHVGVSRPIADGIRPDDVQNLGVEAVNMGSITVNWSATGDDSLSKSAAQQIIYVSTANITELNYSAATAFSVPGLALPLSSQRYVIKGLDPSTFYYVAMKTFDEGGNASALSNVVTATTLSSAPCPTCPSEDR